jgi:hypothetical protein
MTVLINEHRGPTMAKKHFILDRPCTIIALIEFIAFAQIVNEIQIQYHGIPILSYYSHSTVLPTRSWRTSLA